jgi:hypothetical protein
MSSLTRKDPKGFAELYHRVTWTHDTIPYEVAVSKYLSRNKDTCDPKRFAGAQKMRARLLADLKKDENEGVVREGARFHFTDHDHFVTLDAINHTFEGTATPEEIRQTLWLATHYGHIKHANAKPDRLKKTACAAQQFADWYLGMDCTGFVGAFLGLGYARGIASFDKNPARRRQAVRDIHGCDVMIKKSGKIYKHIAVVVKAVPCGAAEVEVHTAESTGERAGKSMEGVVADKIRQLKLESPGVFVAAKAVRSSDSEYYFYPMP